VPEPFTPNTIIQQADLLRELTLIRSRGYALDNEERQPGIRCVGAASRHRGNVIGAITATGPMTRFPKPRIPDLAELVMSTAARITASIENG
jgi:DNA-binding IclR family transcriptional regulator